MKLSNKLAIVATILFLGIMVIYTAKSNLGPSDWSVHGNTSGNLYNGGYFCEYNDYIYFSNLYDDGTLYRMNSDLTNFIKISDDKVSSLNVTKDYIYYSRKNHEKKNPGHPILNYTNPGIYRLNLKSSKITTLSKGHTEMIHLNGNYIYYQKNWALSNYYLYSVRIDGKSETRLYKENISPASITNNTLYYTSTDDFYIRTMDLDSGHDTLFIPEHCYMPILNEDYLYYISIEDDYSIYRTKRTGYEPEKIVTGPVFTYNVTKDHQYLYYQIDGTNDKRICQFDTITKEEVTLKPGNYHDIHMVGNNLFFTDFADTTIYHMPIGSPTELNTFLPPVLDDVLNNRIKYISNFIEDEE